MNLHVIESVGLFLLHQQNMDFTFGHWMSMDLNELITACVCNKVPLYTNKPYKFQLIKKFEKPN